MRDHTVSVDRSTSPATIEFADNFNVAVSFIDRNIEEGRAGKTAIQQAGGGKVTYGELAENVNRAGNALKNLGIGTGERVLMMVKDCPDFYYLFWGAIKAGVIPVPINTLLRSKDYQFMIEDSGCIGVIYSPEFAGEVEPALDALSSGPAHCLRTEGDGETLASMMAVASDALDTADART